MAKPCSQSWVFNADQLSLQPDGTDRTLSLCDRVPPGRYALVRSVLSTGVAGYVNMARAHGFRGLIFVLGDDRESVDDLPEGRDKLVWAPSRSVASFAWQRHQQMLLDDVLPHDPLPGQFPGPYSARNGDLLVGAAFMCRAGSASNTAHAGQVMAEIRNRLGLDFVVADVDDPCWNYPGSGYAITSMVQAMQRTFRKSAHAVDRPRMSAHYPTFLITPGDPSNAPHMLSPDQAFEPVVNGYTAPFTFPAPRLSPNAGVYGAVRAWQWGRPIDSAGATAGAVQLTVDLRSGGNPSELVGLFTDENPAGGLTVSWSGLPTGFRSVNSGMIVYDDLAAVVAQGPANLGRVPTTYWDYDQGNVWGNIVPSWSPDPVPPLRVGQEFSDTTFGGLILELENWKSGHREVGTLPDVLTVTNVNCPPAKKTVRSWLKFDDLWMTPPGLSDTYTHKLAGNLLKFTGTPTSGDEGTYPLLLEFRGTQIPGTSRPLDNWTQTHLVLNVATTDPGTRALPPPVAGTGSLHGITPLTNATHRSPNEWGTAVAWCRGQPTVAHTGPLAPVRAFPPNSASACGHGYRPEQLLTLLDSCSNFGFGTYQPICSTTSSIAEYLAFAFAVSAVLTGNNPGYSDGLAYGLYRIPENRPYFINREDLLRPSFNVGHAVGLLEAAWNDARSFTSFACDGSTYFDRVRHAFTFFVDMSGLFPGAHGGNYSTDQYSTWHQRGCDVYGGNAAAAQLVDQVATTATCMRVLISAGGLVPFSGGSGPTPPVGSGVAGCPARGSLSQSCEEHQRGISGSKAVDIANVRMTPLYASCDGTISFFAPDPNTRRDPGTGEELPGTAANSQACLGYPCGMGIKLVLNCDDAIRQFTYGHLDPYSLQDLLLPQAGEHVTADTQVGYMGQTGFSTGPHLHYEMRVAGVTLCPDTSLPIGCP